MTAKGFVQSLDLANKCSPQTFMAPQAAKNLSVRLNTCLNTSFLVSTPADQHLSPRLNTWLLNAESCLNVEPKALRLAHQIRAHQRAIRFAPLEKGHVRVGLA